MLGSATGCMHLFVYFEHCPVCCYPSVGKLRCSFEFGNQPLSQIYLDTIIPSTSVLLQTEVFLVNLLITTHFLRPQYNTQPRFAFCQKYLLNLCLIGRAGLGDLFRPGWPGYMTDMADITDFLGSKIK